MHLGHRELLVQLDICAGERRGARDLAINGLHHPDAGHSLPPGVPEVLLKDLYVIIFYLFLYLFLYNFYWIKANGSGQPL